MSRLDGFYPAVVTRNQDRDGSGARVRVRFPWLPDGDRDETAWADLVAPLAGPGFGAWAIPAIGDTVLVGFVAGQRDQPVVLGGLYRRSAPPPGAASRGGAVVQAVRGPRLAFDDHDGGGLVLGDGEGETLALGDADGPAVRLAAGSIELGCAAGVVRLSGQAIEAVAEGGLELAAGELAVEADDVELGAGRRACLAATVLRLGP